LPVPSLHVRSPRLFDLRSSLNFQGASSSVHSSNYEPSPTSIIAAQVSLSAILRSASAKLYFPGETSQQKFQSARQLDQELIAWKSKLPPWLNPDIISFKEPEWTNKQKLALKIRKSLPKFF
jgi:hypothetical protein